VYRRRWTWVEKARIERAKLIDLFPDSRPLVVAELVANMKFAALTGRHPEELPRRRALRALPAVVYPGLTMYLIFVESGRKFVVLHASLARDDGIAAAQHVALRPPLSNDAWMLSQSRFDSGGW